MASIENPYKQVEQISEKFDVSNHIFLNMVSNGIQQKTEQLVPDLLLVPINKKMSKGEISMTLVGQVVLDDANDINNVDNKIRQMMDSLKNPSNLLSLLRK